MKTGLGLCAIGVSFVWLGGPGGPCPGDMFTLGMLVCPLGWMVSVVSLGITAIRAPRELMAPSAIALFLTTGIILFGNGGSWDVNELTSWIWVALFFQVSLTLAGAAANRWRKAAGR